MFLMKTKNLSVVDKGTWARKEEEGKQRKSRVTGIRDGAVSGGDHIQGVPLEARG